MVFTYMFRSCPPQMCTSTRMVEGGRGGQILRIVFWRTAAKGRLLLFCTWRSLPSCVTGWHYCCRANTRQAASTALSHYTLSSHTLLHVGIFLCQWDMHWEHHTFFASKESRKLGLVWYICMRPIEKLLVQYHTNLSIHWSTWVPSC